MFDVLSMQRPIKIPIYVAMTNTVDCRRQTQLHWMATFFHNLLCILNNTVRATMVNMMLPWSDLNQIDMWMNRYFKTDVHRVVSPQCLMFNAQSVQCLFGTVDRYLVFNFTELVLITVANTLFRMHFIPIIVPMVRNKVLWFLFVCDLIYFNAL